MLWRTQLDILDRWRLKIDKTFCDFLTVGISKINRQRMYQIDGLWSYGIRTIFPIFSFEKAVFGVYGDPVHLGF